MDETTTNRVVLSEQVRCGGTILLPFVFVTEVPLTLKQDAGTKRRR